MPDYSKDFGPFDGKIWLNVASEGPLPHVAVKALHESVEWKIKPHLLTNPKFISVPLQLKTSLAKLINVNHEDIILGNSASFGLHLLANGLPLKSGDEVLTMQNDFPVNILPWLGLKNKGVVVKQVSSQGCVLTVEEIIQALTLKTKVVCLSYIHSFSGHKIDVVKIGELCRQKKITFLLNCSQACGAFDIDVAKLPVDAIICTGYKWLLGPYGTGFCWMTPKLRESLGFNQAYWYAVLDSAAIQSTGPIDLPDVRLSRKFDIFATANFFNFVPWHASIEYLLQVGMNNVASYNRQIIDKIVENMDQSKYIFISPTEKEKRTNIIVFSHKNKKQNEIIFEFLKDQGIYLAFWKGNLRIAPHLYNTMDEITYFLSLLNKEI